MPRDLEQGSLPRPGHEEGQPWLPLLVLPENRPLEEGGYPGAGGSVCGADPTEPTGRGGSPRQFNPHVPAILFKAFQCLLVSQSFSRHCLKCPRFVLVSTACPNEGRSHADSEQGGAVIEGVRGGLRSWKEEALFCHCLETLSDICHASSLCLIPYQL